MNATTNRDGAASEKNGSRSERRYGWILEALLIVTVTPALVAAVLSLGDLPMA